MRSGYTLFGRAMSTKNSSGEGREDVVSFRFSTEDAARKTLRELTAAITEKESLDAMLFTDIMGRVVDDMFPPYFRHVDDEDVEEHEKGVRRVKADAFQKLLELCRFQVNVRQHSREFVHGHISFCIEDMGNMDAPEVAVSRFVIDNAYILRESWTRHIC